MEFKDYNADISTLLGIKDSSDNNVCHTSQERLVSETCK